MELVKEEENDILVAKEVVNQLREFYKQKVLMDIKEKKLKEELKEVMLKHNITKWAMELDEGYISATIKEPYIRKTVDTKKLKEDGLYENYLKETQVKESLVLDIC